MGTHSLGHAIFTLSKGKRGKELGDEGRGGEIVKTSQIPREQTWELSSADRMYKNDSDETHGHTPLLPSTIQPRLAAPKAKWTCHMISYAPKAF